MTQQADLEQIYHDYYPLLFVIAYRMLGSANDAEDIVQESYLRYAQTAPKEIHSTKAYLTTIVTHLCLDYLKSARIQREQYAGVWLPEPILTTQEDPAWQTVEQHESISVAFLLLLERLTPHRMSGPSSCCMKSSLIVTRRLPELWAKAPPLADRYSIRQRLISASKIGVIARLHRRPRSA